ncbi:hypothetical protein [Streptomyces roseolus]|uniref:hypothetical protein n=1 Tax=Streptomyces roseolus TaxID=67358 RepID=UPI0037938F4E
MFADTTEAKAAHTVAVLEEADYRCWAPRRYDSHYPKAVTARDYRQAVPVVVTTLEKLQEHGAGAAVWRHLGRTGEQTLTEALDNPDGEDLYRRQYALAEAEGERRRAAEREAERPVCKRCGRKFNDARWEETTGELPGRPGTCRCADRAAPTSSPARKPPPKLPGLRPPLCRSRRTASGRTGAAAAVSAGGLDRVPVVRSAVARPHSGTGPEVTAPPRGTGGPSRRIQPTAGPTQSPTGPGHSYFDGPPTPDTSPLRSG